MKANVPPEEPNHLLEEVAPGTAVKAVPPRKAAPGWGTSIGGGILMLSVFFAIIFIRKHRNIFSFTPTLSTYAWYVGVGFVLFIVSIAVAMSRYRVFYRHIIGLPMSIYMLAGARFFSPWIVLPLVFLAFDTAWLFLAAGVHAGSWDHERRNGGPDLRFKHNKFHYINSPEKRVLDDAISKSMRNWGIFTMLVAILVSLANNDKADGESQTSWDMHAPPVDLATPQDMAPNLTRPAHRHLRTRKPSEGKTPRELSQPAP
jgi:hypothetical protein